MDLRRRGLDYIVGKPIDYLALDAHVILQTNRFQALALDVQGQTGFMREKVPVLIPPALTHWMNLPVEIHKFGDHPIRLAWFEFEGAEFATHGPSV